MRLAEARLSASISSSSSIRLSLGGVQIDWSTKQSPPRTFSRTSTITSPSGKRPTSASPNRTPRYSHTPRASAGLELPVKISRSSFARSGISGHQELLYLFSSGPSFPSFQDDQTSLPTQLKHGTIPGTNTPAALRCEPPRRMKPLPQIRAEISRNDPGSTTFRSGRAGLAFLGAAFFRVAFSPADRAAFIRSRRAGDGECPIGSLCPLPFANFACSIRSKSPKP